MPEKTPTSMAFPASLLSYVQEKHNPRPSNDTVLVNILEDDEGLPREKTYSVWEMKSQNRKIKYGENIHLASHLDEAISDGSATVHACHVRISTSFSILLWHAAAMALGQSHLEECKNLFSKLATFIDGVSLKLKEN
ncbi:hypothetical protein RHMOL_Rhmol05G0242100 [Rhododendron molle]|uniref:Uncharacterized protein n=1 Tax=Rhododendron molle TaxID=49168 RepID=A0ACC0NUP0_RHOML|nr:hypothetical protein RHMOL_Rhmol05G0242100 [Rhododendron molle]